MTMLIGQMLGCLLVAAGIGGAVGWLLRQLTTGEIIQESKDLAATLYHKELTQEKAQYELHVQAAQMRLLESKIVESEELNQSIRQELSGRNDRLQALQEELAVHTQRLTVLEAEEASVRRRAGRNSNRSKDGSIGWKSNSAIETPSIEPHYTNSRTNWPNETGTSKNWSRSPTGFKNKRRP